MASPLTFLKFVLLFHGFIEHFRPFLFIFFNKLEVKVMAQVSSTASKMASKIQRLN